MERLKKIHFKEMLHAWSMSMVLSQAKIPYKSKFALVPLDTLLSQSGVRITLDDFRAYRQLNLKYYGGGVVVRKDVPVLGKNIKTHKQTEVSAGQFLFSKIDARYGAFGIVPKELDGAIVTAEFPVFEVNTNKVLSEFLLLVMTSDEMVNYIKNMSQGSTNRKRMDVATFLSIKLPLPSLEEQKRMMNDYTVLQNKIKAKEKELEDLTDEIQEEVKEKTATTIKKKLERKMLSVTAFKDMENWSVDNALDALIINSDYPMVKLGDWVQSFQKDSEDGSLRVTPKQQPNDYYLYIGMDAVEKNTGRMIGYDLKPGAMIKSAAYTVPFGYFIFGRLRPNLNKYWVNTDQMGKNIVCSTEFFVFSLKPDVDKDYFECILGSDIVQEQIKKHVTGTGLPRINASDFLHVMIPNPPEKVKKLLGSYFKSKQQILWNGRQLITTERMKAKKEFESQIFG